MPTVLVWMLVGDSETRHKEEQTVSWALRISQASISRPGYIRQTKPCFRRGARDCGSNSKLIKQIPGAKQCKSKQETICFNLCKILALPRSGLDKHWPDWCESIKCHDTSEFHHKENESGDSLKKKEKNQGRA